jgi:hypothetical protein
MSISSTGLYGSATIVNSDLFTDVETLKETVTTLNTTYLQTTAEHRADISQNRFDISSNLSKINDISTNKIPNLILDISSNLSKINDISTNKIPNLILDIKNQTFMHVVNQLRSKYFDEITGRIKFTKEFKEMVLEKSKKNALVVSVV